MRRRRWFGLVDPREPDSWITGCAHVISSEMREKVRKDLTFSAVLANPEAYEGETIVWGGKVIDTLNEEGLTLIKILQIPIDFRECLRTKK